VRAVKAGKLSIRTLAAPFSLAGREGELELAPDGRRFTLAISLGNAPLAAGVADNRDMLLPERWRRAIDKSKRRKK
jgi:hypothetical protein